MIGNVFLMSALRGWRKGFNFAKPRFSEGQDLTPKHVTEFSIESPRPSWVNESEFALLKQ